MKKHKHRLVVEISSDRLISEDEAARGLSLLFDRLGKGHWRNSWLKPWVTDNCPRLKIGDIKRFSRVLAAERRKATTGGNDERTAPAQD